MVPPPFRLPPPAEPPPVTSLPDGMLDPFVPCPGSSLKRGALTPSARRGTCRSSRVDRSGPRPDHRSLARRAATAAVQTIHPQVTAHPQPSPTPLEPCRGRPPTERL